jgi:alkylation response protein AidB-like acyl-CoA dehydrogenase
MNEEQQLIVETAKRIFADQCDKLVVDAAEAGEFPSALWNTLEQTGLTLAGVDETAGGSGGSFADALLLIREAGAAAAPIPLAEHLIAASLLAAAKTTLPKGMMTLAIVESGKVEKVRFTETAEWVLWVQEEAIVLVSNRDIPWQRQSTIAGESTASVAVRIVK